MPRGGKRPGAGRPRTAEAAPRVVLGPRVAQSTADYLRQLAAREGVSLGRAVDLVVEAHAGTATP